MRYTHPPPILAGKSIPVDACPIRPVLLMPVAVTQGEGVGGQCMAFLASETHSIYEYGLCICMQLGSAVCGVHRTLCLPQSLCGICMALQVRMTQLVCAEEHVPVKSPQCYSNNPWLSPHLHGRNHLACMCMACGHRLLASAVAAPPSLHVPVLFGIRLASLRAASWH